MRAKVAFIVEEDEFWRTLRHFSTLQKTIVITDEILFRLYSAALNAFNCILIPRSELGKTLDTYEKTIRKMLEMGADRDTQLLAFGGGAVCDFTGFLASTYMRGITFSFAPTSLLAMVDAAHGGKNGLNISPWKNILGTFNEASNVFIYPKLSFTQEFDDWICGFAEVIKHAIISDHSFYHWLDINSPKLTKMNDPLMLLEAIQRAVNIKLEIVQKDHFDQNLRQILNFGHTVGHALEHPYMLRHGEAISLGMLAELEIQNTLFNSNRNLLINLKDLLQKFHLPVTLPKDWKDSIGIIANDKKVRRKYLSWILIEKIGQARIVEVNLDRIKKIQDE